MTSAMQEFISLDFPALLTSLCAALSCALVGNFLVLRRQALLGDAISHAVLPGIVLAFLLTGSRSTLPVFVGAFIAGVIAVVCIEAIRSFARVEATAAMGVVFSVFFALGVVLIEQAAARNVDLDAECLLHGQLESIFWIAPADWGALFSISMLGELPEELYRSVTVFVITALFCKILYKELTLASFDAGLAANLGFSPHLIHLGLMVVVAAAIVSSFEVVGSILVIAMIVCPAAAARLCTDRLSTQIGLSQFFATVAVIGGYLLATRFEFFTGLEFSLNAAGTMAVSTGLILAAAAVVAPRYGILARRLRQWSLALRVCEEDILGVLFRTEEAAAEGRILESASLVPGSGLCAILAKRRLLKLGAIERSAAGGLRLTPLGLQRARQVVRNHRLWEWYLVDRVGLDPDHVHESAEHLEHFTEDELSARLKSRAESIVKDPHGKEIP